jgi:glucose/arabinose dehydrogenase/mono/diheme cytochrome c family protein
MLRSLCATLLIAAPWTAPAALVSHIVSTGTSIASIDGIISPDEYGPGNSHAFTGGGTGFTGQLGLATAYLAHDATHLALGFDQLGQHQNDDRIVLYLNTRPGGLQPDGIAMNDGVASNPDDAGRRNVSILSSDGTETVTFDDGAGGNGAPDFALIFRNASPGNGGFAALFELRPAGLTHTLISIEVAGLGSSTLEVRVPLFDLALAPGRTVDVAAVQVSATGFLSDEGIPAPGFSGNPGFNTSGTTAFTNLHRFTLAPAVPYSGLLPRRPNTTIAMPAVLPPPAPDTYTTENAFGVLTFINPIAVATAPGDTNRLFVVERAGRIAVITNLLAPSRTVFLDIATQVNPTSEGGLLGLAFHPGYATNGHFFVFYTPNANNGTGNGFHTRVSRFTRTATNEHLALPASEVVLFSQFNNAANHNGGDLHFGEDGYLYIATGDEGSANDNLNNSQRITNDFFSALLRLDVDQRPGSLPPNPHPALGGATNYAIPPDNPFIGATGFYGTAVNPATVRTEFFATGLRNPFRFHIDRPSGLIYVADVGQNLWEEVNLVTNGGNYGWAAREGFVVGPKPSGRPASDYANPILVYGHGSATNQGFSITGGVVYRGDRFPDLFGHYLFADYVSGHVWALTHNGTTNTAFRWLLTDNNIAGFGTDPANGDVLLCDLVANQVKRLVVATPGTNTLPERLSETGLFADLPNLVPHEGIVPYDINVPFWSDNAAKRRWFSLPDTNHAFGFNPDGTWTSPASTVWIKHFDLLLTSGVPESARRIETRVLVRNNSVEGGYGVTYRWGLSTNNASLVPEGGLNEEILINDSGLIRTQVWRYPSRGECLACHNLGAGFALSFNTPQMNRAHDFGDLVTNQIDALTLAGYFAASPPSPHGLPRLVGPDETAYTVEARFRSYLAANCAACHYPGGPFQGAFDARFSTPLSTAGLIDGTLANDGGDPANRVVVRADLARSMLHTRLTFRGPGQMPPIGSNLIDTQGLALVTAWINGEAATYETLAEWQTRHFGSPTHPDAAPGLDPDGDGNDNRTEYLTGTQPTNTLDTWTHTFAPEVVPPAIAYETSGRALVDIQVTTNLLTGTWTSLDTPENTPLLRPPGTTITLPDPAATNTPIRAYRARLSEP